MIGEGRRMRCCAAWQKSIETFDRIVSAQLASSFQYEFI